MTSDGKKIKSVLVVGAGVAGVHAALNLADLDFKVYLLEKQPHIGGKLVKLYRTAEDNFALGMITPVLLTAVNNLIKLRESQETLRYHLRELPVM